MTLSLDSIHQPLNDFFLNQFQTGTGGVVLFRFDKFGSVVSDKDFYTDPNHPEQGYSANVATEYFSNLVNRVPIEDPDGVTIFLSQLGVDDAYFEIVTSAIPYVQSGTSEEISESIIGSFSQIKSDAIKAFETINAESSTGQMFEFKPCYASPKDWYDRTNQNNWTHQSFQIKAPAAATPTDNGAQYQLWRKKIDDATIQQIVPTTETAQPVEPAHLATALMANSERPEMPTRAMVTALGSAVPVRTQPMIMTARVVAPQMVAAAPIKMSAPAATQPILADAYFHSVQTLALPQRIAVSQYLASNAPTEPANTDSISISFDYCLVTITRPWYRPIFVQNTSWFCLNTPKGKLTSHDSTRTNLVILPTGLVVIKNLSIQANWAAADVANAQDATQFGPFKVSSGIVNNTLSHEGIQVVGWLLERMPELPPNDPPAPNQG